MFLKFFRPTIWFDAASDDGAGAGGQGGAVVELPEALKGKYLPIEEVHSKYTLNDVMNGKVGAAKQKEAGEWAQKLNAAEAAKRVKEDEVAALTPRLAEIDGLNTQLAQVNANLAAEQAKAARLASLMKFPALLGEDTLALVQASTLEPAALEEQLTKMAARFKIEGVTSAAGASPPAPRSTEVTSQSLIDQAMAASLKGDDAGHRKLMSEAYALMDAKGKFVPNTGGRIGATPA
jgi:hypothetical protein